MNRLLNWFRRGRMESDLDRELQYHFDRRVLDLTQAGLPEQEARRRATLEIGGLPQVREEVRDVWLTRWARDFAYDLRFSARAFLRSPSFTLTTVLSLALGIGATTAIYSLVDQVILHALPVKNPGQLVLIDWKGDQVANGFGSYNIMSYPICRDLQKQDRFFDGVLCRALTTVNLSTGSEATPVTAEIVSGSYFPVLGVGPAVGRVFDETDDQPPKLNPEVVLSYDYWKTQLAGAQDVVGRKIFINQFPMTVIGVAAATFQGVDVGQTPSLWVPASVSSQAIPGFQDLLDRRTRWMQILGRLKAGVSAAQAQAGLQPWFHAMLEEDSKLAGFPNIAPERRRRFFASRLEVTPSPQGHAPLRRTLSEPLWMLFAATAILLGLACLNVAGLFLARGSSRVREISTRLALGASRGRIGRQLLADSIVLALAGGALGLVLAPSAMRALIAFLPSNNSANALQVAIDFRLLLFAFLVSLAAGVLSGFAPAFQAGRESLISALRDRSAIAIGGIGLRKIIVTAQIALSLVLVTGAGLFMRTLTGLLAKGPGFETSSLVSFGIDPRHNGYSSVEANRLIRRIDEEIRNSGIAESSGVARFQLLTGGSWMNAMTIQTNERIITDRDVNLNSITPGFFQTLGVKVLMGRNFDEHDSRPVGEGGEYRSAIVNEAFVKRYLAGRNPLGVRICRGTELDAKPNIEIVGVVTNFNYRGLREESEQAFFPILEGTDSDATYYVKTRGTPEQASQAIRRIVHDADPGLPISYFRTLNEQVKRSLSTERLLATLSGSFGTLALLLSLVGLYGVMSFVVTQRTREIGIRIALGATGNSALWMVLSDALTMILAGTAIALPCMWALGRLVESQLFGVAPNDPATIAGATLLLGTSALIAALLPAYRASTVNPTEALRLE